MAELPLQPFSSYSDDELRRAADELNTYTERAQDAIRDELRKRPHIAELMQSVRDAESARDAGLLNDERRRFPGFVLATMVCSVATAVVLSVLLTLAGDAFAALAAPRLVLLWVALAAPVIAVFDTQMRPRHVKRFAFAMVCFGVETAILTGSVTSSLAAIGAGFPVLLWLLFCGLIWRDFFAPRARRAQWLRPTLLRWWPDLATIDWH